MALKDMDLVFIDLETTGLDRDSSEIIEIAAIRTDWRRVVVSSIDLKVRFDGKVEEEAAAKNGYSPEAWKDAVSIQEALERLHGSIVTPRGTRFIVVAHYAPFEEMMLGEACKRTGIDNPFKGRAWIDTAQLAWFPLFAGAIADRKLGTLAALHDVNCKDLHTAAGDTRILMHVFDAMMTRFEIGSSIESKGREIVNKGIMGAQEAISNLVNNFGRKNDGKKEEDRKEAREEGRTEGSS